MQTSAAAQLEQLPAEEDMVYLKARENMLSVVETTSLVHAALIILP